MVWNNPDGLEVKFGTELAITAKSGTPSDNQGGTKKMVVDINTADGDFPVFGDSDKLLHSPTAAIPANAIIKSAVLTVIDAFTSGGAPTLDIGLKEQDGTEIDHNGLFAAVALSAINADGEEAVGAGSLIATKLSAAGYISINVNTANYTAGRARVIVEYMIAE